MNNDNNKTSNKKLNTNNKQKKVKPFKKFTLRLKRNTYDNLKAIQKIHNKNPVAPFLSLNKMMNKGLAIKYPNNLVKYLKREIITDDDYAKLTKYYQDVLKTIQKIQWQLSNMANNDNQIAHSINTINEYNFKHKDYKTVDLKRIHYLLGLDKYTENKLNKYWNKILTHEGVRSHGSKHS